MNIEEFIELALKEDIGEGDHSSLACIPADATESAQLIIKDKGILAGMELAGLVFAKVDPDVKFSKKMSDGEIMKPGDIAFEVKGNARSILKAERVILNCMQRMSGIASHTNRIVNLIEGKNAKVLDTRKTTPGFRLMEKWAVRIGGGENHRMGLYDMIMIKDNHIDYAGGIEKAIARANEYMLSGGKKFAIEVEARNIDEVKTILKAGNIQRILLDNFSFRDLKDAVALIDHQYETEASGNITENNALRYAECGVDYISVGALTHQINSLDMSLKALA